MDQKHKYDYDCMDESVVGVEVEVQSVQAIFPDAVTLLPQSRQLTVSHGPNIQLRIQLPVPYPNASPIFQLCAPSMAGEAKRALLAKLEEICAENRGEPMLYPIIDSALAEFANFGEIAGPEKRSKENCDSHEVELADAPFPAAFHSGQAIEDRKSVFQAHVAKLTSKDQIPELLSQLKTVGKIARARHNPYAWRLVLSGGGDEQQQAGAAAREIEQHDCDDDGEDGSASKLLRLLVQMDARGVLLVVSRWKGGNKIGPERFRHFCNAARDALISGGFVKHGNG